MKVPINVVRCPVDNGPIAYPDQPGTPYRCVRCGEILKGYDTEPGAYWAESHGFLVTIEPEDGPDTEEEISELYSAIEDVARVLGDPMTAMHLGERFTCTEADDLARALMVGNQKSAAITFLEAHAQGDGEDDDHHEVEDIENYVRELADLPPVELIEEPDPEETPAPTADELLKLMNLD